MNDQKRIILNQKWQEAADHPAPQGDELRQFASLLAVRPLPMPIRQGLPQHGVVIPGQAQPTIIHMPTAQPALATLSELILAGRRLHKVCRGGYVRKIRHGSYLYERWDEWTTCALAAAYAGAFGAKAVERDDWSPDEAIWKLEMVLGYNVRTQRITSPNRYETTIEKEIYHLVDAKMWSREGVALWLITQGF